MEAIGAWRERYFAWGESDPLAFSEATTVGLMLSAAGDAGLIGLLEYPTEKKSRETGEGCYGRCDLWVVDPDHRDEYGWAFEVKHRRVTSRSTKNWLTAPYFAAWNDAGALTADEASKRLACTIFYSESEIATDSVCNRTLLRLAGVSDWAWKISHGCGLQPCYVFMRERQRANRFAGARPQRMALVR